MCRIRTGERAPSRLASPRPAPHRTATREHAPEPGRQARHGKLGTRLYGSAGHVFVFHWLVCYRKAGRLLRFQGTSHRKMENCRVRKRTRLLAERPEPPGRRSGERRSDGRMSYWQREPRREHKGTGGEELPT